MSPRLWIPGFGALALLALWMPASSTRMLTEMVYLSLFALSFNFIYRYLGLLSFGHNLAFGLGAYAVAIYFEHQPQGSIVLAICLAALVALVGTSLSSLLLVRLKGGYFALMTMAICQVAFFVSGKWTSLTKGDDGMMLSAPALAIPGLESEALSQTVLVCWLALAVCGLALGAMQWLLRTPLGQAIVLLRENESRAEFLGYRVHLVKIAGLNVAGVMAGLAGALFALYQGLVSPVVLGFGLSGDVIMMTLIGGSLHLLGPAVGAVIYTGIEDILPAVTSHPRFVMACLFVAVVLYIPDGLTGQAERLRQWRSRLFTRSAKPAQETMQ